MNHCLAGSVKLVLGLRVAQNMTVIKQINASDRIPPALLRRLIENEHILPKL